MIVLSIRFAWGQVQPVLQETGWEPVGSEGERGTIFSSVTPMTNDYPVIVTNIVFWSGELIGNANTYAIQPSRNQDGVGWDEGNHAYSWTESSGQFTSWFELDNCPMYGFRGETLITAFGSVHSNVFLVVSNCNIYDGNAQAFNVDVSHGYFSNTLNNCHQVEEFYRDFATLYPSYFVGNFCTNISNLALNGGFFFDPVYYILNNTFYGVAGGNFTVLTSPGSDWVFAGNTCYNSQGIGIGSAGYQDSTYNSGNSNIVINANVFNLTGGSYAITIEDGGNDAAQAVTATSNTITGAGTYTIWSGGVLTNGLFAWNNGGNYPQQQNSSPYYWLDVSNNYTSWSSTDSSTNWQTISAANGSSAWVRNNFGNGEPVGLALDSRIPVGAPMTVSNGNGVAISVYTNGVFTGTPITLPSAGVQTFTWSGATWYIPGPIISGPWPAYLTR